MFGGSYSAVEGNLYYYALFKRDLEHSFYCIITDKNALAMYISKRDLLVWDLQIIFFA